jgi:hypothetical protein
MKGVDMEYQDILRQQVGIYEKSNKKDNIYALVYKISACFGFIAQCKGEDIDAEPFRTAHALGNFEIAKISNPLN